MLETLRGPLGRAIRERDPCYAKATYTLCKVIFDQHVASRGTQPLVMLYKHLRGKKSLADSDPQWGMLEELRGLTSSAMVTCNCTPGNFKEGGYGVRVRRLRSM